ncbi:cation:proton antiporter [Geminocystis sp. CENA526]|uniref:cation:proton antiporter n=1 Tax=Geminocystis sp. CENA526 TaxID=1355871 RepID=UPI003D6FF84A
MILSLILRLTIWFLLTSDLSLINIIIGVSIALLLPQTKPEKESLRQWIQILGHLLMAIPQAYKEAVEIMIFPHAYEGLTLQKIEQKRSRYLIFLDIFLITFTPKTIVLKYNKKGWFTIHRILRKKTP